MMAMPTPEPVKVFISYSYKDEIFREQLQELLYAAKRQGLIEDWHDRKISPGEEWEDLVDENLETSEIILLLVSPSFIASPYSYSKEMQRALEKHEAGQARVIPIILRPVDWSETPFARLQALPRNGRPITKWSNRDEAWMDVAKGISAAVKQLRGERPTDASELAIDQEAPAASQEPIGYSPLAGRTPEAGTVYVCPRGDYEWSQQSVGERVPNCPHHGIGLVPEEIYVQARRSHQKKAREQKVAATYLEGQQFMKAKQWPKAQLSFEEVQQLQPGYQETEALLAQVRHELEKGKKKGKNANQYRDALISAWTDRNLSSNEAESLKDLAENKLGLSAKTAVDIEQKVMGDTIEGILQKQERSTIERTAEDSRVSTDHVESRSSSWD